MIIYGNNYEIAGNCIDYEESEHIPGDCVILPIKSSACPGLYEFALHFKNSRRKPCFMFFHINIRTRETLFNLMYRNGDVEFVQNVGVTDLADKLIT